MTGYRKPTGRASSVPAGLAIGGVVSLVITLLLTALMAKMVDNEILQWGYVGYGVMFMLFLASFLGALAACIKIKRQILAISIMAGFVYWGILLSITALFFGGQYEAVGVTLLLVAGGSTCAGLIAVRQGRGGKSRNGKRRHR